MKISKIFLVCILSVAMLIGSFSISYATEPSMAITESDGTPVTGSVSASSPVYVKGTATPGEIVMLSILNPMDENAVLSDSTIGTHLYWADDTIAADSGEYSFSVDFSGCVTGDYIVRIATADSNFFEKVVQTVINEEDRDAVIAAINASSTVSDVKSVFVNSDGARNLSLNVGAYNRLNTTSKDSVYQAILDYKNTQPLTVGNLSDFNTDVFLASGALALYNQENTSDIIDEYSGIFKLLDNVNTKNTYDLITLESEKSAALEAICSDDYASIADMQKAYNLSIFLYAVKNVPWQSFDSILSANSYLFTNLATSTYNLLRYKSNVALNISGNLYSSPVDFEIAFNAAVSNQYTAENSQPTGGGSRPGGSFGGGTTVGVGTSSNPQIELPSFEDDSFSDLSDVQWAKDAIEYLKEKGIVSGVSSNTFAPLNTVKREEFIKMLVIASGKYDANADCTFADVPKDNWSYSYIASAFKSGLVNGIDEFSFGLGSEITRQDACVLLYRVIKDKATADNPKEFTDKSQISDYAIEAINAMSSMGLVNGTEDGSFKPQNSMTRAEAAKLLYELCQVIGG